MQAAGMMNLIRLAGWSARPGTPLGGAQFHKGLLERVQAAIGGHPFDGLDLPPLELDGQGQAGEHREPVNQHRAGTAFPQLATMLGSGQVEVLPEDLEEALVRRDHHVPGLSVDRQRELCLQARLPLKPLTLQASGQAPSTYRYR